MGTQLSLTLLVGLFMASALMGGQPGDGAGQAFDLRLQGKADEAKALLEQTLAENPEDAAAQFELARTLIYLGTGNPREMGDHIEAAQQAIDRAVELDPENPTYALMDGNLGVFHFYLAMQKGQDAAKEAMTALCRKYRKAGKLSQSMIPQLYLVELYGALPPDMGRETAKAEEYAAALEKRDPIFGAKARSILLPEEADRVAYWEKILKEHAGNADVLEELGKACLFNDRFEEGRRRLEEAIQADPGRQILLLDIARFHMYRVMSGDGPMEEALAQAEKAAQQYLDTAPIPPMKAYTLEIMAKIKFGMDDQAAMTELREQAVGIDPNVSKASGIPSPYLFVPPEKLPVVHRYLFRPL